LKSDKIKLLDNYQLFQLIQNESIDEITLSKLKTEYNSRNITKDEKLRIKQKYDSFFLNQDFVLNNNQWNPLSTAFALNKHFRHIALLKVSGRKKEAKKYMIKLYYGLTIYSVIIILLIFVLRVR